MKITVYTITDCQFSKQEKDYLNTNKLAFEEKNLETNREFLTEMLAVSNNFAGTPVTKIEKDDGQIVVLKGFTKEEFDKTLGLGADATRPEVTPTAPAAEPAPPAPAAVEPAAPAVPVPSTQEPKIEIVPSPVTETPAAPAPVAPASPAPAAVEPAAPATPSQPDPMANILTSLQEQANAAPSVPAPAAPDAGMPNIPDPKL